MQITESDHAFWSDHCVPVLSALMKGTGSYTSDEQQDQLEFFKTHVLPTFGPQPTAGNDQYLFMSHCGSPIELSVNLSDANPPKTRFSFTPVGRPDQVARAVGADMRWFEQLAATYFLSEDESARVKAAVPPGIPRVPYCLAALDLDGQARAMKAYFGPDLKAVATGVPGNAGALEAIGSLQPGGEGMAAALSMIREFEKDGHAEPLVFTMIGIDCIEPASARIKLYARGGKDYSFQEVRRLVTLGGRREDETTLEGLEILRDIWPLLLNEDEDSYDENTSKAELHPEKTMHSGIMVTYEVQSGKAVPEAKIYVPLFQFCDDNKTITTNMEKVFKKRGWLWGANGSYRETIENAFAHNNVYQGSEVVHTYCTFNFSKKGSYITSYVATPMRRAGT